MTACVEAKLLHQLSGSLRRPSEKQVRVLAVDVGLVTEYGRGATVVNPWLQTALPALPLNEVSAADLTSRGLALALADVLKSGCARALAEAAVTYLYALVEECPAALMQLGTFAKWPLFRHDGCRGCKTCQLASLIEARAKAVADHGSKDWTQWASTYEIWFQSGKQDPHKFVIQGVDKGCGSKDMGGVHLTGGRLWAGSVILARWMSSLAAEEFPSSQPVLEIASGLGLVGLSMAKRGIRVVMSDYEPVLLDHLRATIDQHGLSDRCRVLPFDWLKAGEPRWQRLFAAQKFSTVVGSDVIYDLQKPFVIAKLLRSVLPYGGKAFFTNATKFRTGVELFSSALRAEGFQVHEAIVPCDELQKILCGDFEPDQEYGLWTVSIPPIESPLPL